MSAFKWRVIFSFLSLFFGLNSLASDGLYFSGFGGFGITDLSGFGTKFTYGLRGGFRMGDRFTTGLFYQVYSTHISNSLGSADIYIVPLLIEANFHLLKATDGPYLGLKMGGIRHSSDNITPGFNPPINSANDFSIGVCGGFNFELIEGQSWGVELDSFNVDAKPSQYSFYSITANYTLNL